MAQALGVERHARGSAAAVLAAAVLAQRRGEHRRGPLWAFGTAVDLDSDCDQTFLIEDGGAGGVLKISKGGAS